MQQHQMHLDGARTPVFDTGGDASEAVLFVHGNPGCGADWLPLMADIGEFCRAIAPDMPGFGGAEKPENFAYTIDGYATHLGKLVDALGLTKVHLVLHDFGGPWGLAWAAKNPERVASVTLFNIGVMPGYQWHYMARLWRTPIIGEILQAITTRFGFDLALKHGNPRGLPREFVDRMFSSIDKGTKRAVLKLYRATSDLGGAARELTEALKPLDLDALVVWGKADPYVPHRFAEAQREVFPRVNIVYLEDSGHWPFADNPQAVSEIVIPFLRARVAAS
ncbi:MAG: alpha/beta hydrolase [Proteobacteria bacterium]|nr:alpha/beta hydrolase [Pseudomonadota bacterium]